MKDEMIISFVQTKGGTGKSTLSLNTAFSKVLEERFESVALVEFDPQGTLQSWWMERKEEGKQSGRVSFHHLSSTQREVLQEGIKSVATHNRVLILDIPGEGISKLHTKFACAVSDLVVIPMRTSTNDEAAFAKNLLPIIQEIIKMDPKKKNAFRILPSFTHPQIKLGNLLDYFQEILPPFVQCLGAANSFRSVYENYNRFGTTLREYTISVENNNKLAQQASKAVSEVEQIVNHILQIVET